MRVVIEREQTDKKGFVVLDWIINVNRVILMNDTTGVLEIDKDMNLKRPVSQIERDVRRVERDAIIGLMNNFDIDEWDSEDPRSFEVKRLSKIRRMILMDEVLSKIRKEGNE